MDRIRYRYKMMTKITDKKCFLCSNFAHCSLLSRVSQFSDWDVAVARTSSTFTRESVAKIVNRFLLERSSNLNNGIAIEDQRVEKTFITSFAQRLSYQLNLMEMTILRRKVR